ncbi:MAG TPA: type III-B CRISPR-associated protein Cas10/Cmr2, partial [Acidobacteriota bacterium]|nr:type III-B CRISPR-associated protein Cas10/Cmr2 [Acidobacteriota bacterium]
MDKLAFWKQKIVQALHDPPAKPYASYPDGGGHASIAGRLFEELSGQDFKYYNRPPDWAASGADRPVVSPPARTKGSPQIQLKWPSNPILTHPLCPGARILANRSGQEIPSAGAEARNIYLEEEFEAARELADPLPGWQKEEELRSHFLRIWRRFRDALIFDGGKRRSDPLVWQEMPADSRCPDHSIWDHLKVTTSLAFLGHRATPDRAQDPFMLRFSIGGVQRFIEESRTSRDLWVSSFLIADLIWQAMIPIVERYGPDAIVYPDLRGNPRADGWLSEAHSDALPDGTDFGTYAAVLPNAFTALVPRGEPGHSFLVPLQELAQDAESRVAERWKKLGKLVKDWLENETGCGKGHWQEIWDRQQTQILPCSWTAIEWRRLEKIQDARSLSGQAPAADQQVVQRREDWLRPFVDDDAWRQYEHARQVYAATNLTIHQCERGFDYAVTHHQLLQRHMMRRLNGDALAATSEPGEKCSLCGRRQALTNHPPEMGLHKARRHANDFWKRRSLNPDPDSVERLCAVCASKRFLVEGGVARDQPKLAGINPFWAGPEPPEAVADQDGRVRVPFPSTAMLAAQDFLVELVRSTECRDLLKRVVKAHEKADLPRTSFARSLKSLARHSESESWEVRQFLKLDIQAVLFPQTLTKAIDQAREENERQAEALEELQKAVQQLLNKASKILASGKPKTGFAVIRLDGDSISRLLLGDAEVVQTCWQDVLHPDVVKKLGENPRTKEAGWSELLEAKRLFGPSLHAFVSRSLAAFAHRIVPWVVESEFPGRLIYCGGDDILCLAPAEHALPMAARLQQLFSAAWVIDTTPKQQSWS